MKEFIRNEEGQSMVEYALILALISVVAITALNALGGNVKEKLGSINTELASAGTNG